MEQETTCNQPSAKATPQVLLTRQEACTFLGIRPRTLDDWRTQRALPCIARGRWIRFRRSDLEAFLEAHTLKPRENTPFRPRPRKTVPPAV